MLSAIVGLKRKREIFGVVRLGWDLCIELLWFCSVHYWFFNLLDMNINLLYKRKLISYSISHVIGESRSRQHHQ